MAHSEIKTRSLEESAVKTAKLDDLAVTNAKLGTDISADKLTAGTLPDARFPATLPAVSGANLTGITTYTDNTPTITSLTPDVIENTSTAVVIAGTNFVSVPAVEAINTSGAIVAADSVSFTSSTSITATFTLPVDGTYFIRVENNSGLAVRTSSADLTVSDAPAWVTASGSLGTFAGGSAISTITLTATDATSFAVTTGAVTAGLTFSTGVGSATITGTQTAHTTAATDSFTVTATDAEGQTAARAFTISWTFGATGGVQLNQDFIMATSQFHRTLGSGAATTTYTLSMWVKRTSIGLGGRMFSVTGSGDIYFRFNTNDTMELSACGGDEAYLQTNRKYNDPTAWYHIVFRYDSTESVSTDRFRLYVNGVDQRDVGGYSIDTMPSASQTDKVNLSGNVHRIASTVSSQYFAGCLSHCHLCIGYSYAPTVFGETDSTSGIWKIILEPSVSYGTNGWFLKFEDRSNLDLDSSPNAHTFTTAGTPTPTYDNPSNNFATLNSISPTSAALDLKNANTCSSGPNSSNYWQSVQSTLGARAGKWYFEFKDENAWGSTSDSSRRYGICDLDTINQIDSSGADVRYSGTTAGYAYMNASGVRHNGGTIAGSDSTYPTFVPGDILMCAMDLDNGKLYFGKNGTWLDSSDPTSGATGTGSVADISTTATWSPYVETHYGADVVSVNYGNGYFRTTAITSAGTNAGVGEFEYDVPTGYYALCTKNIKAYGG